MSLIIESHHSLSETNLPQIEEGAEIIGQLDSTTGEGATATEATAGAEEATSAAPEVTTGEANVTTEATPGAEGQNVTVETSTAGEATINETLPSNETAITIAPIVIAPSEDNVTVAGETVEFSTSAPSGNETSVAAEGEASLSTTVAFSESENITVAPQGEGEAVTVEAGAENVTSEANNATAIGGAIDVTPSNVEKEETAAPEHAGEEGTNATESSATTPHGW